MARGLVIEGDNLDVLRELADDPEWRDARLAYLDPPFNTHERWGDFHDSLDRQTWLALLRDRLEATWALLAPTGSLWLHCDDRMQHHARVLLDDLVGEDRFVATVVWQRRYSRENRKAIGTVHEYLHVYAPLGNAWREHRNRLPRRDPEGTWRNPDDDPRGPWSTTSLVAQAGHATPEQHYAITTPSGKVVEPPPGSCWRVTRERFGRMDAAGEIWFGSEGRNVPRRKVFLAEAKGLVPWTWWPCDEVGHTAEARAECARHAPGQVPFATPKPERLMARIIEVATDPGDLVLDPFLGSGTTAVVAHRLDRRWVGIERERRTLDLHVLPRLASVAGEAFSTALRPVRSGEGPLVD